MNEGVGVGWGGRPRLGLAVASRASLVRTSWDSELQVQTDLVQQQEAERELEEMHGPRHAPAHQGGTMQNMHATTAQE